MADKKRLIDADGCGRYIAGRMGFNPANVEQVMSYMAEYADGNAIGAVEVVHGEWTVIEDDWNEETIYQCSACKEKVVTIDGTPAENLWNYCPNCGAKMDGGGNG